jgi:solute carrier family 6 serotonin transporter-like protein 4
MLGTLPGIFWRMCWTYISPLFLGVSQSLKFIFKLEFRISFNFFEFQFIFFAALFEYKNLQLEGYIYPNWSIVVGWLITLSSLCCIPFYAIYLFFTTEGTAIERLVKSFRPIRDNEIRCNRDELLPINSQIAHVWNIHKHLKIM